MHQDYRRVLLFLVFLAMPIYFFYISPVMMMEALPKNIITFGVVWWWGIVFVGAFVVGRLMCGWYCPMGAAQMILDRLAARACYKIGALGYLRYLGYAVFLLLFMGAVSQISGSLTFDPSYSVENGVSVDRPERLIVYYALIGIPLAAAFLLGRRAFCHHLCPFSVHQMVGTSVARKLKYPSLHLEATPAACVDCKACTRACPMDLPVHMMVKHGNMNDYDCIHCGACIESCPKAAIRFAWIYGNQNAPVASAAVTPLASSTTDEPKSESSAPEEMG